MRTLSGTLRSAVFNIERVERGAEFLAFLKWDVCKVGHKWGMDDRSFATKYVNDRVNLEWSTNDPVLLPITSYSTPFANA
jgi:hypothetical protein